MNNQRFGLGVVVHIFNMNFSKIFLLKRNREKRDLNKADWGSPGGRVEWGEKLVDAVAREVKEETGIDIDLNKLKLLDIKEITENPIAPTVHFLQFIYSTNLDESNKITLDDESEEFAWFDLKNLPERTLDSKEKLIKLNELAKKEKGEE